MGTIRVATWNVWWRHGDWQRRQQAIAATLPRIGADVIGLQEVSAHDPDQLAWFRDELGYHVAAAPDAQVDHHGVLNAVASRWPISEAAWDYLDVGDMRPHRTVLRATIDAPVGALRVFCTHLSHGFDQSGLRRRQLDQIAALVAAERGDPGADYPPILLGDLNAVPESDEIRRLTGLGSPAVGGLIFSDAWAQAGDGTGVTYSADNPHVVDSAWPDRRLDYVLVGWPRPRPRGNPVSVEVFGTEPVDGIVPSDHYGVVADLAT